MICINMALPTAQPAEILRAYQKDNLYKKQCAESFSRLLPPRHVSKAEPLSSALYKCFTTLKDLQTLGEEYSGIIQVDESYNKLPTFLSRLISIVLSTFGETITRKIFSQIEKNVEKNPNLKVQTQTIFLIVLRSFKNMIPQIENIHRALSYVNGGPMELGKTIAGIDYVHMRPAATARYAHLRLLGIVTSLHALVSCGQIIYNSKKHIEQVNNMPKDVENNESCVACLEEIVQPCVLPCGHIFCMQCSYGALDSCALCRSSFSKNTVVPLMNYCPVNKK